jgi:hypothetical protein
MWLNNSNSCPFTDQISFKRDSKENNLTTSEQRVLALRISEAGTEFINNKVSSLTLEVAVTIINMKVHLNHPYPYRRNHTFVDKIQSTKCLKSD